MQLISRRLRNLISAKFQGRFVLARSSAVIGIGILVLTIGLTVNSRAATSSNSQSPLGMNLNPVNYYTPEMPFLNILKTSSTWVTHSSVTWDTGEEQYLQLDSDGYPTTLLANSSDPNSPQIFTSVGVLVERNLPSTPNGTYPAGTYVVLYDGQGTLTYGFDASLVSSTSGRDVINVSPSGGGIDIRITATDPAHTGNYLRNIRLVKAENESALSAGQVFNPAFLSLMQKFRVLRFMDWFQTNGSPVSSWSNRPLLTNYTWGTMSGTPIEAAVQLVNAISADAWLNIPHMADNNYITQMATLVHAQLGSSQKVYLEFSNEVWNGGFAQYAYAATQGQLLWPTQTAGGAYGWNRNWYGMRVAQACDIWKSAWGADSGRVICVLGAQGAATYSATSSLGCAYWTTGAPCSGHGIGAVAIAPYFGYSGVPAAWTSQSDGGLTLLFQSLYTQNDPSIPAGGWLSAAVSWETSFISALAPYKLPLVAYEGGQSFSGFPNAVTAPLTQLYFAANRDARMGTGYTTYLNQWKSGGGQLFMLYNDIQGYSQGGEWGALESIMQTTTPLSSAPPKWQAIQNFISANTCWWSGCAGTVTTPTTVATPMPPSSLSVR